MRDDRVRFEGFSSCAAPRAGDSPEVAYWTLLGAGTPTWTSTAHRAAAGGISDSGVVGCRWGTELRSLGTRARDRGKCGCRPVAQGFGLRRPQSRWRCGSVNRVGEPARFLRRFRAPARGGPAGGGSAAAAVSRWPPRHRQRLGIERRGVLESWSGTRAGCGSTAGSARCQRLLSC